MDNSALEKVVEKRYLGCSLDLWEVDGDTLHLYLKSHVKSATCPECGCVSSSIHRHYTKKFADLPIDEHFLVVHLEMSTLTCRGKCARSTFFPAPHDFLPDPYAKKTARLTERILQVISENSVRGAVAALREENIKCDKNTVSRMVAGAKTQAK